MSISLVGSVVASSTSATSLTPDFGALSWAADDVALALVHNDAAGGQSAPTPPTGWTLIGNFGAVGIGEERHSVLYGKKLAGGEDTTPTFDLPGTAAAICSVVLAVFRGVDTTDWEDATVVWGSGQNDGNPANPAITTITNGAWVVLFHAATDGTHTGAGAPAGFTLIDSVLLTDANNFMAYRERSTAGVETPGVWTHTGTFGTTDYTTATYALTPAAGPISVPIGLATETDEALALTPVNIFSWSEIVEVRTPAGVAIASGTDSAFPVTAVGGPPQPFIRLVEESDEALELVITVEAPEVVVLPTGDILSSPTISIAVGLELLDENDVLLADISDDLVTGSVARNMNATIHGTARLQVSRALNWHNQRLRPYMTITELITGALERFDLGIYLPETPTRRTGQQPMTFEVEAYDKLVILDHPHGIAYTASAGAGVVATVEAILDDRALPHALSQSSVATLPSTRSWPLDEANTTLRIINDLLGAINYRGLYVDRNGIFRSEPYRPPAERAPVWHYDAGSPRTIIGEVIEEEIDLFSIPNWWVFIRDDPAQAVPTEGDGIHTVLNYADGPTSISARGRVITRVVRLDAADQASLVAAGNQIVGEDRQPYAHLSFTAVPNPLHWHADSVRITSADLGLTSDIFGEQSWSLPLDGGDMTHEVRRAVTV
jgi:hypothetical protein